MRRIQLVLLLSAITSPAVAQTSAPTSVSQLKARVAETFGAWLTAFAVAADGTLTDRRIWADLSGPGIYPDGICLDTDDAAWVATATQPRCVRVLDGGEIVEEAGFSQNFYACALGGPDRRTLYAMTAPTSVQAVALLHRGD